MRRISKIAMSVGLEKTVDAKGPTMTRGETVMTADSPAEARARRSKVPGPVLANRAR